MNCEWGEVVTGAVDRAASAYEYGVFVEGTVVGIVVVSTIVALAWIVRALLKDL